MVEAVSGIEPESKRQQSEVAAATIALNYARAIASKECTDNAGYSWVFLYWHWRIKRKVDINIILTNIILSIFL